MGWIPIHVGGCKSTAPRQGLCDGSVSVCVCTTDVLWERGAMCCYFLSNGSQWLFHLKEPIPGRQGPLTLRARGKVGSQEGASETTRDPSPAGTSSHTRSCVHRPRGFHPPAVIQKQNK